MAKKLLVYLFTLLAVFSFAQTVPTSTAIRINQLGFYPQCSKLAVVVGANAGTFYITSLDLSDTVYTGTLGSSVNWALSGENVQVADFSSFCDVGNYILVIPGLGKSYPFKIDSKVHLPVSKSIIKAYYFQRASTPITAACGGVYARAAGHPDNNVIVLPSAASTNRPAGTVISTPKGWYDAGDYNKYIVNSGISTYTLLAAYEHFPAYYDTLKLNIPESGNSIPDLLDETLWNLHWMLTMQDPYDGGVYNKTTNANFDAFIMPDKATTARYVVAKGTAATLDFAAVMAQASRIFKPYLPSFSDSCLAAAKFAWQWGRKNPAVQFINPLASGTYPAVVTGGYPDSQFGDEMEWAANELYITTKADSFYTAGKVATVTNYGIPFWATVRTLGLMSLAHHRKNLTAIADTTVIKNKLIAVSTVYKDNQGISPYRIAMGRVAGDFSWGGNSNAGNQAMLLIAAYQINNDINYWNAALSNMDYILGRNATAYSFVTGNGSYPPMHPHHRVSEADGIVNPVPGLVAGGPQNKSTGDSCTLTAYPATSYSDLQPCYTLNEVTINWNAPFVFLTGALDAINPGSKELKALITANGSIDLCDSGSVILSCNTGNGYTYQWKKDGKDIAGATTSSYTASATGKYTAAITNGIYKTNSNPIQLNIGQTSIIAIAGTDQTITKSSTLLAGNKPPVGTGLWTVVNGGGNILHPSSDTITVTGIPVGTSTFRWSIISGSCPSSSSDMTVTASYVLSGIAETDSYEVRPNPFIDATSIQINSSSISKLDIQVSDLKGILVYSSQDHFTNEPIYLNKMATGMYIVRASYRNKAFIFKIVKNE